MKISRRTSLAIQWILDQLLPPVLRDSRWFMYLPMKAVFGRYVGDFMDFKAHAFTLSEEEFSDVYRKVASVNELQGETDLNEACTRAILASVTEGTVLEVGSGRGYLAAKLLAQGLEVTACDIVVSPELVARYPDITFVENSMEHLPFPDASFDTVVTTHTLEHVQELAQSMSELRRVARHQLVIVVPKQRPYVYNFSLHINFFPYEWSLVGQLGHRPDVTIKDLGDWYYEERVTRS
jgi:ubiquinone/menaquinone biosynthesis C-methylase UbiE